MRRAIRESVMSTSGIFVDRKAGIIHGVKVLGFVSENGRRYTPAAVKAAVKLYENVRVNVDHPEKDASQPRSAYDRLGKLINICYVEGEGLYGDLEILMTHPMAERICEAAERMPDAFGMSHNAQGEGEEDKDGIFVVSRIAEVRHVDLVADSATTKSLSESKQKESQMDDKLKEALGCMREAWGKLEGYMKEAYGDEDEEKADTQEAEDDDSEKAEKDDEKGGKDVEERKQLNFSDYEKQVSRMSDSEINIAIQDILNTLKHADEMDRAHGTDDGGYYRDQASVLRKELQARRSGKKKQQESIEAEGEDEKKSNAEEGDLVIKHEDDDAEGDDEKGAMESRGNKLSRLVKENRELKAREYARALCESAGVKVDAALLNDLAVMPKDAAKRTVQRLAEKANKPRSGYAITESRAGGIPEGDALFNWLRN